MSAAYSPSPDDGSPEGCRPVVVITGGGSGIGAATARHLADVGWRVVVTGRRDDRISRIASEIGGLAVSADMTNGADIAGIVAQVIDAYRHLDGLVLNAGLMIPGSIAELTVDDWRRTLEVNVTGPFMLLREALPYLLDSRGAVVAVGSIGAGVTGPASAAYGASKAALVRLIRSTAVDYGPAGVRANAVNPGWIRSEMADAEMDALGLARGIDREAGYRLVTKHVPARRAGTVDEAAAAIAWLLSPQATYVNGAVLTVDGGTSVVGVGTLAFGTVP